MAAAAYAGARLLALAAPAEVEVDPSAAARAARRLREWLGLEPAAADAEARRCLLLQRDRRLHETLALSAAPELLRGILDEVPVDGLPRPRGGTLLVALHYGPYSSLLWLALARGLPRLAVLVDRALDPNLVLPEERARELEAHGLLARGAVATADVGAGRHAVRRLASELRAGGTALLLADPYLADAADGRALRGRLGRQTLAFPRGAAWLAQATGCRVAAAAIHLAGEGHRVTVDETESVDAALARLLAHVEAEPAPWEGWLRRQPGF